MAKDLFSEQAAGYATYRPTYPPELFDYLLSFVKEKNTAWDCATGNGQAAVALARVFKKVFATDISAQQLQQAIPHEAITYSINPAEKTTLAANSIDLVTVAQAYHWFDFDAFCTEVKRVVRPGGIISIWGYGLVVSEEEKINKLISHFYRSIAGPYWDPERKFIDEQYKTVPFPYDELPPAQFTLTVRWAKTDLTGYMNTWSAVKHFINAHSYNPLDSFANELQKAWLNDAPLTFNFPLFLRLGRV